MLTLRQNLVLAKALGYAIAYIDKLPPEKREASDRDDMVDLLLNVFPHWVEVVRDGVAHHTGTAPVLVDHKLRQGRAVLPVTRNVIEEGDGGGY